MTFDSVFGGAADRLTDGGSGANALRKGVDSISDKSAVQCLRFRKMRSKCFVLGEALLRFV